MPITGTDSVYPASLPAPQQASIQSVDRRVLSPEGGLFEARAGQTDRLSIEEIVFPPLTPEQATTFDAWWRDDLLKGGLWFAAAWPRPEGQVLVARRFLNPPNWEFIGAPDSGYWRVVATFEVRGAGELPINPDPPSAWNPLDMLSAFDPVPLDLTDDFRISTRERNSDSYEGGVRGFLSHSTSGRWYFELKVLSSGTGLPEDQQYLTFGIVDDSRDNVLAGPPPHDNSDYTDASAENLVLVMTRLDGPIVEKVSPAAGSFIHFLGDQPQPPDVFGFAWDVGTSIAVYRNGSLVVTVPFAYTGVMFPYMSAGATLVGADTDGNGESVLICTGKRQFSYFPPDGFFPWG